jgi:aspartate kinase
MKLIVMKFGGTSVGDADCFRRAAEIVSAAAKEQRVVVVVSAMSGVTNRLVDAAHCAAKGDESIGIELADALEREHSAVIDRLLTAPTRPQLYARVKSICAEMTRICQGIALLRELTPRALAAVSCVGERLSAPIMSAILCDSATASVAIDATDVIVTDEQYNQAEPLMEYVRPRVAERLVPLLDQRITPVVTGFMGATTEGVLTTLGRGGSDYSATTLGSALDADEVIIWTDVDGVLTADPGLVPGARLLRDISYNEAAELAYFGAKVLHPKTLRPVVEAAIPVWIRNSLAPERAGTRITATGRPTRDGVRGITAIRDVTLITVGGRGIVGVVGVAARTFAAVAEAKANVLLISQASSENDICLIVESVDAERTAKQLRSTFASDFAHHDVEHITVKPDVAIVAVIGEKMRGTPGIAGRIFSVLGQHAINIIAIAQGSSEYNISFVVEAKVLREAVNVVHEEFRLHVPAPLSERAVMRRDD